MKKGIVQIFVSNLIFLLFGVLNNFILPKYLSVDSYAMLKTYMLYISYASVLGFGFIEGMFLFYGGKTVKDSSNLQFGDKFRTYIVLEFSVSLILLLWGLAINNSLIIICSFGIFITNIVNYFKNYVMAVAEYKTYSIANSFEKIGIFLFNALLIFQIKTDNYIVYILVILLIGIIESAYYAYIIDKRSSGIFRGKIEVSQAKTTMSMGIVLLFGNLISSVFIGIDQWFVKILMNNNSFAIYAFAVSLQRLIALFITPITRVLYNYFCKQREEDNISFLYEILVIWSFLILLIVFPLNWFVESWISKYGSALTIVAFLFCSEALSGITNGIYINLYKAKKQQNKFLIQMITMSIIAVMLNALFYYFYAELASIAIATLVTKMIWLLWCKVDLKGTKSALKEGFKILLLCTLFLMTSFIENAIVGGLAYFTLLLLSFILLYRRTFINIITEVISLGKKMLKLL